MTSSLRLLPLLALLVLMAACVAGPNDVAHIANAQGIVAGFWRGLWQGAIAPFTFLISLFTNDVQVYEVHNNGGWYNFGFLLGAGALTQGSRRAARRRPRKPKPSVLPIG